MRILFAGSIENMYQTGAQRLHALEQIGHEVTGVSMSSVRRVPRIIEYARRFLPQSAYELLITANAKAAHKMLIDGAERSRPEIIWLEWPSVVAPETIKELKERFPQSVIASFQDDNPFGTRRFSKYGWQRFFDAIPYYDIHLVKRPSDIVEYTKLGAKRVQMFMTGYSEEIYFPEVVSPDTVRYPVIFIGTALDNRVSYLEKLTGDLGVEVHIFGGRWDRTEMYQTRKHLIHGFLSETGYRQAVCAAKIVLGFVSHSNQDEYAGRTFEVPACGSMFLCERTPAQQDLYEEGKEVVFFDSPEDCRDKINYYLSHDDERAKIAAGGLARSQNYGIRGRMKEAVSIVSGCRGA